MITINDFYEVQHSSYNMIPCKLIDIKEEGIYVFQNLHNGTIFSTPEEKFREIEISQVHFDRLGFKNQKLDEIFVAPASFVLGTDLRNLTLANFGYIVFHSDELDETQKLYSEYSTKLQENFSSDNSTHHKERQLYKDGLRSVSTINELFTRLEKYGIVIENKEEIITGINK